MLPSKPSHFFGYWRPWKENSELIDSYLNYSKDVTLAKYGADVVGTYISQASKEQVDAINELGQKLGLGMSVLSEQLSDISSELNFLNRNISIQIEQQQLTNLLLENIIELLRVPDSEKERQQAIELGVKFFVNAQKNDDLFDDAIEQLLKAESLMKQDYFVLHRLGLIYMHSTRHINVEKALDYFTKAAKYASVESDPKAIRLINVLKGEKTDQNIISEIHKLASESYEKAAFAAYVLGQYEIAVSNQLKAVDYNNSSENYFMLSKYQTRINDIDSCLINLGKAIEKQSSIVTTVFRDIDLINEPSVLKLIQKKNHTLDDNINQLIEKWKIVNSTKVNEAINELTELLKKSYDIKVAVFKKYEKECDVIIKSNSILELKIQDFINEIKQSVFLTFKSDNINELINELIIAKKLPYEQTQSVFDKIKIQIDSDILKLGSNYGGGIVIFLDNTGHHGLILAEKYFDQFKWGVDGKIGASGNGIADGSGMENTKKIFELSSSHIEEGFFRNKKILLPTAARFCLESNYNGYIDWYLPTKAELELIIHSEIVMKSKIGYFIFSNSGFRIWSSTEFDRDEVYISWRGFRTDGKSHWSYLEERRSNLKYHKGDIKPYRKSDSCFTLAVRAF